MIVQLKVTRVAVLRSAWFHQCAYLVNKKRNKNQRTWEPKNLFWELMPNNAQERHAIVVSFFFSQAVTFRRAGTPTSGVPQVCVLKHTSPCSLSYLLLCITQKRKYLHAFSLFPLFLCTFSAFLHSSHWHLYRQHHLTCPVLVLPLNTQHIWQPLTWAANSKQNCISNRWRISFFLVTELVSLQLITLILL